MSKVFVKAIKGLNVLTDVKFVCGFIAGAGTIAIMLGNAVGYL